MARVQGLRREMLQHEQQNERLAVQLEAVRAGASQQSRTIENLTKFIISDKAEVQVKCKPHTPLANRDGPDPYTPNKAWWEDVPRIAFSLHIHLDKTLLEGNI
jgi:hypothetical protein